ncbi:hypothetical protein GMSM_19860 [Geomonas sp. Red276]
MGAMYTAKAFSKNNLDIFNVNQIIRFQCERGRWGTEGANPLPAWLGRKAKGSEGEADEAWEEGL